MEVMTSYSISDVTSGNVHVEFLNRENVSVRVWGQRQFSRQKLAEWSYGDVISVGTTRSFTFTLNATGDGNWCPCRHSYYVMLCLGFVFDLVLIFVLWARLVWSSFLRQRRYSDPGERAKESHRMRTTKFKAQKTHFPARPFIQSAFVCIRGRNASRGTCLDMHVVVGIDLRSRYCRASFDSSHTYQT